MLIGAMVWAYIIGQACAVLANLDVHESRCAGGTPEVVRVVVNAATSGVRITVAQCAVF